MAQSNLVNDMTDNFEKSDRMKIEYLKDIHGTFAWGITLSSTLFIALFSLSSKTSLTGDLVLTWIIGLFISQVVFTYLHRVYNNAYIDNLIGRISYLNLQRTLLIHTGDISEGPVTEEFLRQLATNIQQLKYLNLSDAESKEIHDAIRRTRKYVTWCGSISMLSFITNTSLLLFHFIKS